MKLDILIVDLLVVSFVLVPYLIFIWLGLKQSRDLKTKFFEEARLNGLHPEIFQKWNLNYMGLDKNQQNLLFVQKRAEGFTVEKINLKGLKKSRVRIVNNSVKIKEQTENVLQRIDLELEFNNSAENKVICLFDRSISYCEDFEVKNAEKWDQLINSCISQRPLLHSAA